MKQTISLSSLWKFFDKIYYLNSTCEHQKYFDWYDVPITCTTNSVESICKKALEKKYKHIIIFKKNVIPTESITYFNVLQLIEFIKETKYKWDIITLSSEPDIYYSDTVFMNSFIYQNEYSNNYSFLLNQQGIQKILNYNKQRKYLHYHPNLFLPEDYSLYQKVKKTYSVYIGSPLFYTILFAIMYYMKQYIIKIIKRFRRPQINVIVRNHNVHVVPEYQLPPQTNNRSYSI